MINTSSYPLIQINQENLKEGSFSKKLFYNKSFLTKEKSTIFHPSKNHYKLSLTQILKEKKNGFSLRYYFMAQFQRKKIKAVQAKILYRYT